MMYNTITGRLMDYVRVAYRIFFLGGDGYLCYIHHIYIAYMEINDNFIMNLLYFEGGGGKCALPLCM